MLSILPATGIIFEAYSPLGNPAQLKQDNMERSVLENTDIVEIAKKHSVSPAQVGLSRSLSLSLTSSYSPCVLIHSLSLSLTLFLVYSLSFLSTLSLFFPSPLLPIYSFPFRLRSPIPLPALYIPHFCSFSLFPFFAWLTDHSIQILYNYTHPPLPTPSLPPCRCAYHLPCIVGQWSSPSLSLLSG